jgi:hypothetical protein
MTVLLAAGWQSLIVHEADPFATLQAHVRLLIDVCLRVRSRADATRFRSVQTGQLVGASWFSN